MAKFLGEFKSPIRLIKSKREKRNVNIVVLRSKTNDSVSGIGRHRAREIGPNVQPRQKAGTVSEFECACDPPKPLQQ